MNKALAISLMILAGAIAFDMAEAYELSDEETRGWCSFYGDMGADFHTMALMVTLRDEYQTSVITYMAAFEAAAVEDGWSDENRSTWIPAFIEMAAAVWEFRDDLSTEEIAGTFETSCLEDQLIGGKFIGVTV